MLAQKNSCASLCFFRESFFVNSFWIESEKGLILIDAQALTSNAKKTGGTDEDIRQASERRDYYSSSLRPFWRPAGPAQRLCEEEEDLDRFGLSCHSPPFGF